MTKADRDRADNARDAMNAWGTRWNKKAKGEVVVFEPGDERLVAGVVPTGLASVDSMLGGGFPRGKSTILFGEPSAGKTLLAQIAIAQAQKLGGTAAFIDAERTYDPKWFAATGVDVGPDNMRVARPESLEQTFDMIEDALVDWAPDVIVLDSIPSLVPQSMLTDDKGKPVEMSERDFRGLAARKMTEGARKMTHYNRKTALIYINQMRTDMGVSFGNPETMSGGRGIRHWAATMVRVRRGKWLTSAGKELAYDSLGKDRVGFLLRLRTEKNKTTVGFQETEFKFYFDGTVDPVGSLINLAIQRGVIVPSGSFYEVPGVKKRLHGLGAVEEIIKANDDLRDRLVADIEEAK